jgi:hypothetical protein
VLNRGIVSNRGKNAREKLKKDEGRRMKDEGRRMKGCVGFADK